LNRLVNWGESTPAAQVVVIWYKYAIFEGSQWAIRKA
jgi:hypothetical protein